MLCWRCITKDGSWEKKITKSPSEQYSISKIKIEEIGNEIKPLGEYENAFIVFDDILGSSNCTYNDQFFIRGRHINLDKYCLSQPYFDLPNRTIRNKSTKIFLINQTLKDEEKINRDIGRYDMSYDELKKFCGNSWEEEYNFLCFSTSKNRDENRYCVCKENKNTYIECVPQTNPF